MDELVSGGAATVRTTALRLGTRLYIPLKGKRCLR